MDTPTTPEGLARYDGLPPAEAVVLAWTQPGKDPAWHEQMRQRVRREMPVLARALDRLSVEEYTPPRGRRPHAGSEPPLWQQDDEGG